MSRAPIDVRRAHPADVEDLLALWSYAREEANAPARSVALFSVEQVRGRLRDAVAGGDVEVLLARWDGRPAGYAVLRVGTVFSIVDSPALHVEHLFVTPELRRRGVARALLAAVASVAERHGADQVLTSAPPSARETHRFLARLGFSPLVVRRVVATPTLRRRLAGESRRRGLEDLLSRRRSLRARARRPRRDDLADWDPQDDWAGADGDDLGAVAAEPEVPAAPEVPVAPPEGRRSAAGALDTVEIPLMGRPRPIAEPGGGRRG